MGSSAGATGNTYTHTHKDRQVMSVEKGSGGSGGESQETVGNTNSQEEVEEEEEDVRERLSSLGTHYVFSHLVN